MKDIILGILSFLWDYYIWKIALSSGLQQCWIYMYVQSEIDTCIFFFTHNYTFVFKILGHVIDLKGLINPDTWLSPRTNSKDHQGNSKTTLPGKLPHPTEDNTTGPVKNNLEVGYSCWQWEEDNSGIILALLYEILESSFAFPIHSHDQFGIRSIFTEIMVARISIRLCIYLGLISIEIVKKLL